MKTWLIIAVIYTNQEWPDGKHLMCFQSETSVFKFLRGLPVIIPGLPVIIPGFPVIIPGFPVIIPSLPVVALSSLSLYRSQRTIFSKVQ